MSDALQPVTPEPVTPQPAGSQPVTPRPQTLHREYLRKFLSSCWNTWNKKRPLWDLMIVFLTIVMLLLAIRQYHDSSKQLDRIDRVSERLSTQYLKDFPSTLGPLGQFIAHTEDHLDVMVDFLGYGDFSSPDDFETLYMSELRKVSCAKKVRIIVYDEQVAAEALKQQFPNNSSGEMFAKFKASHAFENYFAGHHRTALGGSSYAEFKDKVDYASFIKLLLEDERVHRKELEDLRTVQIHNSHGPQFAVLLWIRDGRDAVFSFPFTDQELLQKLKVKQLPSDLRSRSGDDIFDQLSKEVTFRSSDRDLINVFQELFEEEWRRSSN